ncbi:hypothetical protein D917_05801 [Trichinella nativa]|uniref:Protein quiver n=1 Tax=Trichinella nativa TaxID=6335 RepID=A0A1Y3EV08_9BILA|nr:hypothetical protein D917_05801 [Trichinella nativa]
MNRDVHRCLGSKFQSIGILVDLVRAQIQSIHCYYCASPMPPQTDDYEKHVAKLFFSKLFSLPPISDNCNDATPDALFKLNKQTCRNSNCTKITVTTEEFKFTIRGCKDGMLKNPHKLQNAACLADQSPTVCECSGNLCNKAQNVISSFFTALLTVGVYAAWF